MNPFDKTDDPRRRLLIQMLAAGAFSLQGASALAQIFGGRPDKLPAGRSIYRIQGRVLVDGKEANLNTPITPTSTIETPTRDGEIVYVSGSTSYIQRGNSRVVLERPAETTSGFTSGLRLIAGALLSVFPKGTPQQIKTKTATVGIRGTGVYLEAEPDQTYFCTCYGVADVSANDDPESKDTVVATHHDKPLYIVSDAQKGRNIRRAPFINHTDQELMLIESLVGRTPPFVFPKEDYTGPRRDY